MFQEIFADLKTHLQLHVEGHGCIGGAPDQVSQVAPIVAAPLVKLEKEEEEKTPKIGHQIASEYLEYIFDHNDMWGQIVREKGSWIRIGADFRIYMLLGFCKLC